MKKKFTEFKDGWEKILKERHDNITRLSALLLTVLPISVKQAKDVALYMFERGVRAGGINGNENET